MSLTVDPNHPWRSTAFAKIPVMRVSHSEVSRGTSETIREPEPVGVVNRQSTRAWLDELDCTRVSELSARDGMLSGWLSVVTEVGSAKKGSADNAVSHASVLPYEYGRTAGTQLHMTYAGRHFIARPNVDETVVSAMYSADSADKWVTAAGIKLPRMTNPTHGALPDALGDERRDVASVTSNFEGLRRMMAECAKKDDYGDRLFNLARVVCHASVKAKMKLFKSELTPAMYSTDMSSILTTACTGLTPAQVQGNAFIYVHTDESDDYRAFLTMGLRGVQQYTGQMQTIYSQCLVEAEAKDGDIIRFVRVAGADRVSWAPPPQAYTRVLENPDVCLAYYYAYARSMGLGHVATAVLCQTAIGPHVWMGDAISPYKNCRPKLDAARYVILPTADDADVTLTSPSVLINQAALIGASLKAGLGGMLMAFKSGKDVDSPALMAGVMQRLSDPETRRTIMHAVTSRYRNGAVGLEWLTPFSYDVRAGVEACVSAWRNYGFMIADYNVCPISTLTSCLTTGVDMTNSLIGRGTVVNERAYAQLVMCCLASGAELPGLCERPTAGLLATVHTMATKLREWQPVVNIVLIQGVEPENLALQTTPPRDTQPRDATTTTAPSSSERSASSYKPTARPASPEVVFTSRPMVAPEVATEPVRMRATRAMGPPSSSEADATTHVVFHGQRRPKLVPAAEPSSSSQSNHRKTMSGSMPRPLLTGRTTTVESAAESGSDMGTSAIALRGRGKPNANPPAPLSTTWADTVDEVQSTAPSQALAPTKSPPRQLSGGSGSSEEASSESNKSMSSKAKTVRQFADNMDI